jgi:hypothetical protein
MNEIINYECEKCHIKPQPGILIMAYKGLWVCGKCLMEYLNKEKELLREKFIKE